MARIAPPSVSDDERTDPAMPDHVAEALAIREEFLRQGEIDDEDRSPQAFYERITSRPDVREIMKRLANN